MRANHFDEDDLPVELVRPVVFGIC